MAEKNTETKKVETKKTEPKKEKKPKALHILLGEKK